MKDIYNDTPPRPIMVGDKIFYHGMNLTIVECLGHGYLAKTQDGELMTVYPPPMKISNNDVPIKNPLSDMDEIPEEISKEDEESLLKWASTFPIVDILQYLRNCYKKAKCNTFRILETNDKYSDIEYLFTILFINYAKVYDDNHKMFCLHITEDILRKLSLLNIQEFRKGKIVYDCNNTRPD